MMGVNRVIRQPQPKPPPMLPPSSLREVSVRLLIREPSLLQRPSLQQSLLELYCTAQLEGLSPDARLRMVAAAQATQSLSGPRGGGREDCGCGDHADNPLGAASHGIKSCELPCPLRRTQSLPKAAVQWLRVAVLPAEALPALTAALPLATALPDVAADLHVAIVHAVAAILPAAVLPAIAVLPLAVLPVVAALPRAVRPVTVMPVVALLPGAILPAVGVLSTAGAVLPATVLPTATLPAVFVLPVIEAVQPIMVLPKTVGVVLPATLLPTVALLPVVAAAHPSLQRRGPPRRRHSDPPAGPAPWGAALRLAVLLTAGIEDTPDAHRAITGVVVPGMRDFTSPDAALLLAVGSHHG